MGLHDGSEQVVRNLRAAVLSTVVVLVSLLAHLSAGGDCPPVAGLVAGWGLLTLLLLRITRHELGLPLVLGLLIGGQLLVHVALSEAAAASSPSVTAAVARMAAPGGAHDHHPGMAELPSVGAVVSAADTMAPQGGGLGMLAAHLLASVAVGVWLVAGERAIWQLVRIAAVVVLRSVEGLARLFTGSVGWLAPTVVGLPGTACRVWSPAAEVVELALGASSRRRGPPEQGC